MDAKAESPIQEYTPTSVLMTGCAGFIGSNVLVHLVRKYPNVKWVCFDKLNYCGTSANFKEIVGEKNFKFVKGDIASADLVNHILASEEIDTIVHFAAETHVDNSFGNSFAFTVTNVIGTHVLLEAARLRKGGIRRFIHVSTDEVYGEAKKDQERMTERDDLNPTNPYSATKAAAEYLVRAYRACYGLPTIITRGNNVYGPKQYPEKLIPKFINMLARGMKVTIHGSGENQRSFLHVDDVSKAFDIIIHRGKLGAIYNIGSNYEYTNMEVAKKLIGLFGHSDPSQHITHVQDRAFNDFRYHIDMTELEQLGWKQEIDFDTGLKMTKEWFLTNQDHWGDISKALSAHPTFPQQTITQV